MTTEKAPSADEYCEIQIVDKANTFQLATWNILDVFEYGLLTILWKCIVQEMKLYQLVWV